MTNFRIDEFSFSPGSIDAWGDRHPRHSNWPVVYTIDGTGQIYIGESINGSGRLRQHLDNSGKKHLTSARVIIGDTFNKSACLDLESFLIRLIAGDGQYEVINRNDGITDADYYGRSGYQLDFENIFESLREKGLFSRSIREIENTDLFKLSPFKALNQEQSIAVEDILSGLFDDIESDIPCRIIIRGQPGTGKTIVAVYLMKLLSDIEHSDIADAPEGDSLLSEFFVEGYPELLYGFKVGLVVPQQSLRKSIQKVFMKTPGLNPDSVISPFQVGQNNETFDLLIVDETHRLSQRANQTSAQKNTEFKEINEALFGRDKANYTQLDWINAKSTHQIYLLDSAQSVRPMDVSAESLQDIVTSVVHDRNYRLTSQMRVRTDQDYVGYIRRVLAQEQELPESFDGYDLRFFDSFPNMVDAILSRDDEVGLARLLAGYAWRWKSKKDKTEFDIAIGDIKLRWNQSVVDWINSPTSRAEVGSIHTIQGYDLNYAAVIIGNDLRMDPETGAVVFDRQSYFDRKGKQNNPNKKFGDDDLLEFVRNIYAVLLTRGMLGTYIYVCDPHLREYLRRFF